MKPTDLRDERGKPLPLKWQKTLFKLVAAGIIHSEYADQGSLPGPQMVERPLGFEMEKPFTRSDWDNARYTCCVCWSEACYDLID